MWCVATNVHALKYRNYKNISKFYNLYKIPLDIAFSMLKIGVHTTHSGVPSQLLRYGECLSRGLRFSFGMHGGK